MKLYTLAVLVVLGCATTSVVREPEPTLVVSYQGVGVIKVWVSLDGGTPIRLGSVQSGLPECFVLPRHTGTLTLWASELGSRDAVRSPDFTLTYRYWVWQLASSLTTTRINLVPTDYSCKGKKTDWRT